MSDYKGKALLVIIDGIGDVTIPAFGDRTPLQVAHTPNLDAIAAAGLNGQMDSVEPGLACGSDTSHMNILGYDPRQHYRGRGAFESMGAGLSMAPGDIAFKSNFATLNPNTGIVETRRADRHFEHLGPALCAALDGLVLPSFPQHAVSVRYATEHRCGVVVRGAGLTDAISGTDPLRDNLPLLEVKPLDESPQAAHTAAVVNELSSEIQKVLRDHPVNHQRQAEGRNPANVVLLRGCGSRIKVPSFEEVHGLRPCLVAPTKIIAGLGMSFDIDVLEAPGGTGSYDTDFASKASTISRALTAGGYGFGLLHVKAVDDTGHDRMVAMKVKFLEAIDVMIGQILAILAAGEQAANLDQQQQQQCPPAFAICVTGDHSTPVVFGDHSHEPVPFALAWVRDAVAARGGLQQLTDEVKPGVRIPVPDTKQPPPLEQLLQQAAEEAEQRKRTEAALAAAAALQRQGGGEGRPSQEQQWDSAGDRGNKQQAVEGAGECSAAAAAAAGGSRRRVLQAEHVLWDGVVHFDELSAALGVLGRFPGSGVMPLIRQVLREGPGGP